MLVDVVDELDLSRNNYPTVQEASTELYQASRPLVGRASGSAVYVKQIANQRITQRTGFPIGHERNECWTRWTLDSGLAGPGTTSNEY